jgi:hypothetical protein
VQNIVYDPASPGTLTVTVNPGAVINPVWSVGGRLLLQNFNTSPPNYTVVYATSVQVNNYGLPVNLVFSGISSTSLQTLSIQFVARV